LLIFSKVFKPALYFCAFFIIISCEDKISDISVTKEVSDEYYKLTLKISKDIVNLNESILVETNLERISEKDSLESSTKRMIIDAVAGTINGHSFSISSSITITIGDDIADYFKTSSSFIPDYSYDRTKDLYYNYKATGSISAAFENLQITIPVQLMVP